MLDFMESFDERQIRYAGTEFRRLIEFTAKKAQRVSQVRPSVKGRKAKAKCFVELSAFRSYYPYQIGHSTRGQVGLDLYIITYHLRQSMPRSACLHRSATCTGTQYLPLPAHHK